MKGLLIKDIKLMFGQGSFLAILPIVGALIVVPSGQLDVGFGYITSVSGLIAMTTINLDSYDNGYSFLFTLPISRKGYVKEKYLFSLISSAVMMAAVGTSLWLMVAAVHPENHDGFMDFIMDMRNTYLIVLMALSFLLPIFLEFGAEKSRYIILILCGIFTAVMVGVTDNEILGEIFNTGVKGILFVILNTGLLAGSYAVSCCIMEGKDF